MAKPRKPSSYELLAERVRHQITGANNRGATHVRLERFDTESPADWDRLLEEFETVDYVTVTRTADGEALVSWNPVEAEASM
ncbi:DUF1654 domain-containing protein [Salinicola sp. JS01]|uniref:DUF1654 domain-containing protein n=1 Tax=Salinicola sp. JS01 TaxID=3050071 RepID=UPI00255BC45F|nr:DUF1654 domain-containing protein [Salinicola sp. JS01]WIX32491.1 DUF1654 domain-containing protein [Salinicola sp. JS01]